MFERFTERARQVVVLAREEARLLKHNYIGTEHLLVGLLREQEDVAAWALEGLGMTVEAVRDEIARIVEPGGEYSGGQIPFTPRAKKVLELALREALSLGHNYIGTEHVLLGLVREDGGVASRVMSNLGADADTVRSQVIRMLAHRATDEPSAQTTAAGVGSSPTTDGLSVEELGTLIEQLISEQRVVRRRLQMLQADIANVRSEREARRKQPDEPGV